MIEVMSGFPGEVLAVKASGQISGDDYRKVLIPAALAQMKDHKYLRLYCEIVPGSSVTPGAVWEDTKIGIGHWGDWGRMAVVSDIAWVQDAMRMFAPFFHHPVRTFTNADAAQARAWISEKE